MRVFKYSEARQNFSALLNAALDDDVIITRKDGSKFKIIPLTEKEDKSPFDVEGIDVNISMDEILDAVRESREE